MKFVISTAGFTYGPDRMKKLSELGVKFTFTEKPHIYRSVENEIEINTLEQFMDLVSKCDYDVLVGSSKHGNSIIVYDDYME